MSSASPGGRPPGPSFQGDDPRTPGPVRASGPSRSSRSGSDGRSGRPPVPAPLEHPVADSHCHLDIARGPDGEGLPVPEALELAASVGVPKIVQIGCDLPGSRWAVEAAETYDALVAGVALHPNDVPELAERGELDTALAEIDRLAGSSSRVRAIGESGLDHFRTPESGWAVQEVAFRAHIELAKRHGKALVIHDRDAHDDVLRVLDEEVAPERVVMHCFSGDVRIAEECVRRGYFLSFAGTVTFRNAGALRAALDVVPLEKILVETDAPFLTPDPYRGRPNASYLIPITMRYIVEVKGVSEEGLGKIISGTTSLVFGDW